jgi:tripartite-type tricarboxylate transporter receptor subunit TctC
VRPLRCLTIGALALLALTSALAHPGAWAQAARTIRVIISVPPGGSIDVLIRSLADQIGKTKARPS